MERLSEMKDNWHKIKKPLLAVLILEAIVLFVIEILSVKMNIIIPVVIAPFGKIAPFGIFVNLFQWSVGVFFVISLYVLTTHFLATHEKYILPFFIIGTIMLILNLPLHLLASYILNFYRYNTLEIYLSSILYIFSNFIMYSIFPPSLMLLILRYLKIFEKQNALIKTMIITAMMFPLIVFAVNSSAIIYSVLSKI